MSVEFIRVNHSIPDACALAIHTPAGVIVQTGDFKVDFTPIEGGVIDLGPLRRAGQPGRTGAAAGLHQRRDARAAPRASGRWANRSTSCSSMAGDRRIIIATFSSNIHRIQQIIDVRGASTASKVAVSGRSMVNVVGDRHRAGLPQRAEGHPGRHRRDQPLPLRTRWCIITTGSQGEPMSALTRMAMSDHRKVEVDAERLYHHLRAPHPRQREDCRPGGQRADEAGRGGDL